MALRRFGLAVLVAAAAFCSRSATGQCGSSIVGHFGGETTGVAQVSASTLIVARGTEVEMFSLAVSSAPAPYSPRRKAALDAPAVKISMTPGASKAFVLMTNGNVKALTVAASQFVETGFQTTIHTSNAVDIVADGSRVYIALSDDPGPSDHLYSRIRQYDAGAGDPAFVWEAEPLTDNYFYDRLAILNGVLWAGFHEVDSVILGVQGFNISNPASPSPLGAALTNGPLGAYTARISAMTAFNGKLLVSYRHGVSNNEDWLRAVNVSVPTNPVWNAPFDLNGYAGTMSFVNHQLRISIKNSGVGTWDTQNPAALTWLGGYFDQFPKIGQMVSVPGTDYWAGGPAGLMTMNTTNPAAVTPRSSPIVAWPTAPKVVRQRGNTTVVLDYTLNALRLFDYTLLEGQQLRGSIQLPNYSELVELGDLSGGAIGLACVASKGNPSGDVIAIIDITNPTAPVHLSTITGFRTHLLSVSGSRLYAFTANSELKIYELAQPLAPQLRSTTPYGGISTNYTCMTSWSNNAAALGSSTFGLWLINTTNATAPLVSAVWNPVAGYRVHSMCKTPNYLYTSASVSPNGVSIMDTRLEVLVVSNIASPTQRFAVTSTSGFGNPGVFSSLTYVPNAVSNFLIGTRGDPHLPWVSNDDTQFNSVTIFQLASFFFTENVPTPIATLNTPLGHGKAAVSADGSRILVAGDGAGLYQIAMPTSWAPGFGVRPFDQRPCYGGTVTLAALAFGSPNTVSFQWYRDNVPLTDGPTPWGSVISGSSTIGLEISNVKEEDAYRTTFGHHLYTCKATNTCGTTTSAYAVIDTCYANCDCSTGTPSLTANDFTCFTTKFAAGDDYANCDRSTGTPALTGNDFVCFLTKFAAGCW